MSILEKVYEDGETLWQTPDGCTYEHKQEAYGSYILGLCGCGEPKEAFNFLHEILTICDSRDKAKWEGTYTEEAITSLILMNPKIAAHTFLHLLTDKDVIEHGGSVGGSWLTTLGEEIVDTGKKE